MIKILTSIILLLTLLSCQKEYINHNLLGTWNVKIYKTTNHITGEVKTDTLQDKFWIFEKSSGYVNMPKIKYNFTYYTDNRNIIMKTLFCEKTTWYIVDISDNFLHIEHSSLSPIVAEYKFYK